MVDKTEDLVAPAGWLEALEESEADLEAGRTVPLDMVLRDLRDSIARLEAGDLHRQQVTPRH